jgi:hypothetical protein
MGIRIRISTCPGTIFPSANQADLKSSPRGSHERDEVPDGVSQNRFDRRESARSQDKRWKMQWIELQIDNSLKYPHIFVSSQF